MPGPTTPHTESGQNQGFEASDQEGRAGNQTVARGEDAYTAGTEGAQTATNRGAAHAPGTGPSHHGSHPIDETMLEGNLGSRTPEGGGQGISNRAQSEENAGQAKVVAQRPDVQSAINELKKEDKTA